MLVKVSARCPGQPPPRLDAIYAAFPLTNKCKSISASLVGSNPIFVSMGIGNSERTSLTLLISPAIMAITFGGLDSRFILWGNSSNLFKR